MFLLRICAHYVLEQVLLDELGQEMSFKLFLVIIPNHILKQNSSIIL
jgi:hypothetical protein